MNKKTMFRHVCRAIKDIFGSIFMVALNITVGLIIVFAAIATITWLGWYSLIPAAIIGLIWWIWSEAKWSYEGERLTLGHRIEENLSRLTHCRIYQDPVTGGCLDEVYDMIQVYMSEFDKACEEYIAKFGHDYHIDHYREQAYNAHEYLMRDIRTMEAAEEDRKQRAFTEAKIAVSAKAREHKNAIDNEAT